MNEETYLYGREHVIENYKEEITVAFEKNIELEKVIIYEEISAEEYLEHDVFDQAYRTVSQDELFDINRPFNEMEKDKLVKELLKDVLILVDVDGTPKYKLNYDLFKSRLIFNREISYDKKVPVSRPIKY